MEMLVSYLIKSIIASGVMYMYYHLALKNKKFHSYNRFYLILSIVISLTIPLINFRWVWIEQSDNNVISNYANAINSTSSNQPENYYSTGTIIFGISALISILLLLFLLSRIIWIYSVKKTSRNIKMNGFTIIETKVKQAPFSFLNNLFWKQGISATDDNGSKIFKHELTHIIQKHSYDKLFTQVVFCLFWMNPFYWLIQRELNTIHEFIADSNAVEDGDTESFAMMLLHAHNEGSYLTPSHRFFNSSIKRRLIMISTSHKSQYSYARRILALPIILFVLAVLTISVQAQTDTKTSSPAKEVQISVSDTIPNSVTAPTKSVKPVTVKGQKLNKNSDLTPITTTGTKLNRNVNVQTTTVSEQNANVNADVQTTTVTNVKTDLTPVVVTGQRTDIKPIVETSVTVTGQKIQNSIDLKPVTTTVQQSDLKPTVETIELVTEENAAQSSEKNPKKAKGKQSPKKSKPEEKPVKSKKFE